MSCFCGDSSFCFTGEGDDEALIVVFEDDFNNGVSSIEYVGNTLGLFGTYFGGVESEESLSELFLDLYMGDIDILKGDSAILDGELVIEDMVE
jgi:hypothetical protein